MFLNDNNLNGKVPTQIGLLSSLQAFAVGDNLLNSRLPTELGLLTELMWLSLELNDFSGTIPTENFPTFQADRSLTRLLPVPLH